MARLSPEAFPEIKNKRMKHGLPGGDSIALKKGPKKGPKVNLLETYARTWKLMLKWDYLILHGRSWVQIPPRVPPFFLSYLIL